MRTIRGLATIGAVGLLMLAGPAHGKNLWKKHGASCDDTAFERPSETALEELARCVRRLRAYRHVDDLEEGYRQRVRDAARRLYLEGDASDEHLAILMYEDLGAHSLPGGSSGGDGAGVSSDFDAGGGGATAAREERAADSECDIPEPSRAEVQQAKRHYGQGYTDDEEEAYEDALAHYLDAVEAAPGWSKGRYHAATMYARQGKAEKANEQLACVRDIGTDEAVELLRKARKDPDFAPIRDQSSRFKKVTGYARIKIGNSIGKMGQDNVDNIVLSLAELDYPEPKVTEAPREYEAPQVWFKPHSRRTAYIIVKLLNHPDTKVAPVSWEDEQFDVIVAWGDDVKEGEKPKARVKDPADAEEGIEELRQKERQALREPKKVASEVEDVMGQPAEAADEAKGAVEDAKKTGETIKKSGEKAKDFGF